MVFDLKLIKNASIFNFWGIFDPSLSQNILFFTKKRKRLAPLIVSTSLYESIPLKKKELFSFF